MKNKIESCLEKLKNENKKALVTFITSGCGGYDFTEEAVLTMEKSGADIVEIGIPFSDPVAESPVIQSVAVKALAQGTTIAGTFEMIKRLRTKTEMPIIMTLYMNNVFCSGIDAFFKKCNDAGVDGVIIHDLPYEELDDVQSAADSNGIIIINNVTPVSLDRIEKIAKVSKGFLYCLSCEKVNVGEKKFDEFFDLVHKYSNVPNMLGFGISGLDEIEKIKPYCDGTVVDSSVIQMIDENDLKGSLDKISGFVGALRKALD